jgi:hypothetical protein
MDAFSSKTVATAFKGDIQNSVTAYAETNLKEDLVGFTNQIKSYFADIITNGREITFRVTIDASSAVELTQDFNDFAETYADWIRDWVKANAKMGAARMQRNTAKEIYFTNVRISNVAADGTQFNAYDFANAFRKEFSKTFQIKTQNTTQGLADAYVIIK